MHDEEYEKMADSDSDRISHDRNQCPGAVDGGECEERKEFERGDGKEARRQNSPKLPPVFNGNTLEVSHLTDSLVRSVSVKNLVCTSMYVYMQNTCFPCSAPR